MNKVLNIGRYLFPLSFLLYVGLHFGMPQVGASLLPSWIVAPLFWNYFTGTLILTFIICCLVGSYDKLASVMMALYVLLMIFIVHIPRASTSENDMLNIFRNLMIIGALLIYAKYVAKDNRIIG
ncbi:hypothetical protein [uncultured Chryseobacterium sp.]|uniref:hypothetical protein n=1 Tax=uncultured Chryseobacterium sp. TaxID=259322 RepID=UPI00258DE390|nr:hypothetical protein [uncultured Chryseobacterium sp.]